MPISPIVLSRRQAELGRIRLGQKGTKGQPQKLDRFRFTSPTERYITDLAALYGGEPQPWDNNGKAEFEVFTEATSIPVIAVKGGLSQWMETWSGGGCTHRCDGERDVEGNLCDPKDRNHAAAKPTTRLSVMLPELEAIGVFRMETHGWNAAAEIPAVAELAAYVGDLVPAVLHLVERRAIKDGKTSRFVVPVLDLQIGTERLREIVAQKAGITEAPAIDAAPEAAPALAAAPAAEQAPEASPGVQIPTPEQIEAANADLLGRIVDYLVRNGAGDHPAAKAARDRLQLLTAPKDEPVDAEIVEKDSPNGPGTGDDANAIWHKILAATGRLGWDLDKTSQDFKESMGGLLAGEASADELAAYLRQITTGEQVSA